MTIDAPGTFTGPFCGLRYCKTPVEEVIGRLLSVHEAKSIPAVEISSAEVPSVTPTVSQLSNAALALCALGLGYIAGRHITAGNPAR